MKKICRAFAILLFFTSFQLSAQRVAAIKGLFPGKTVIITSPLPKGVTSDSWTAKVDGTTYHGTYVVNGAKCNAICNDCPSTPSVSKPLTNSKPATRQKSGEVSNNDTELEFLREELRIAQAQLDSANAEIAVLQEAASKKNTGTKVKELLGFDRGSKKDETEPTVAATTEKEPKPVAKPASKPASKPTPQQPISTLKPDDPIVANSGPCSPNSNMTWYSPKKAEYKKNRIFDHYAVDSCFVLPKEDLKLATKHKFLKGKTFVAGSTFSISFDANTDEVILIAQQREPVVGKWILATEEGKGLLSLDYIVVYILTQKPDGTPYVALFKIWTTDFGSLMATGGSRNVDSNGNIEFLTEINLVSSGWQTIKMSLVK